MNQFLKVTQRVDYTPGNTSMLMDFQDFLSWPYVGAREVKQQPSCDEISEGMMEVDTGATPESQDTGTRSTKGMNLLALAVFKMTHRCKDAKESQILNLNSCSLFQVPIAVYYILKATCISICNLSGNLITKIPPELGTCFCQITTLNLSSNQFSSLPNELINCTHLQSVDISSNSFVVFPNILLEIESITEIIANINFIADVNVEAIEQHDNLEIIHLEENPLDQLTHARLSRVKGLRIVLTERKDQGWEDLSW